MFTADAPNGESVRLEYIALAPSHESAEQQKDILRMALPEIFPAAGDFIDAAAHEDFSSAGFFLRCIRCELKGDYNRYSIRAEEERSIATSGAEHKQFKLHISRPSQPVQIWTIEMGRRKLAWYPVFKSNLLRPDGRLSTSDFAAVHCLEGINCPSTVLYKDRQDCTRRIRELSARKVDLTRTRSVSTGKSPLLADKIIFLSDVRMNTFVRATFVSKDTGLSIKTSAKALRSGSLGELIPVEIRSASDAAAKPKVLEAQISGDSEVEIVR